MVSPTGFRECAACGPDATSPNGSVTNTDCTCNAGYTGANGGPCEQCEVGKFKDTSGSAACAQCAENSGKNGVANTICLCDPRYSGPGNADCTACGVGFYKDTAGTTSCIKCSHGRNSSMASTSITSCNICDAGKFRSREILTTRINGSGCGNPLYIGDYIDRE